MGGGLGGFRGGGGGWGRGGVGEGGISTFGDLHLWQPIFPFMGTTREIELGAPHPPKMYGGQSSEKPQKRWPRVGRGVVGSALVACGGWDV